MAKNNDKQERMKPEVLIMGIVVAFVFACWVTGMFSPETMLENALPEQIRLPTATPRPKEQARIEIASVVEKPVGLGRIQIRPGTYRQGWAYNGNEIDIFGWEEAEGVLYYDTHIDGKVRNDVPENKLCSIVDCSQPWSIIDMTMPTAMSISIPGPTPTLKPTATSEKETIASDRGKEISIPSSASGAGFFFLVFLAILGLGSFFKILKWGGRKGSDIAIRQLEKREK